MRGFLPWLVRWSRRAGTIDFSIALAALVSPVQILFSSPHTFHYISPHRPHRPATWAGRRAGSPVFVSLLKKNNGGMVHWYTE